ncbi:MAG: RNA methyltransferase [Ruminococcaceae bacterium]|nr:RNA methyltransferase [Oscillospiraceae bacterium]
MEKPQEIITSRQNPLIKLTASLTERKFRDRECLFRFDGKKLFLEALNAALPLFAILFKESAVDAMLDAAGALTPVAGCRAAILPDALFDRISEEKSPEGVICLAKRLDKFHKIITINKCTPFEEAFLPGQTLLVESVRDPGNLGTIIRSAAAFGVAQVVLSADCADLYHPRTIRAAMGTLFHTRVLITPDFAQAVAYLGTKGRVFAAALDANATALGHCRFGEHDSVIVGNEGHGISDRVLQAATDTVYIPMAPGVESLNAGVAASVLLWEFYRGR